MRIGYLTDLHYRNMVPGTSTIAKRRCREVGRLLERALDIMASDGIDLLLCTGDLLDDPQHPAAMDDLGELRDLLASLGVDTMILPGNHDPHPEAFFQVFERPDCLMSRRHIDVLTFAGDHVLAGERASVRSDLALREMQEILSAESDAGWTVVAQHYLVYPERNEGYPHNYANGGSIRSIMEQSERGILSISGHYHPGASVSRHNGVSYFVGSAFCEAPHRCYVVDLEETTCVINEHHCMEGV